MDTDKNGDREEGARLQACQHLCLFVPSVPLPLTRNCLSFSIDAPRQSLYPNIHLNHRIRMLRKRNFGIDENTPIAGTCRALRRDVKPSQVAVQNAFIGIEAARQMQHFLPVACRASPAASGKNGGAMTADVGKTMEEHTAPRRAFHFVPSSLCPSVPSVRVQSAP